MDTFFLFNESHLLAYCRDLQIKSLRFSHNYRYELFGHDMKGVTRYLAKYR